jgi:hypothetical protein
MLGSNRAWVVASTPIWITWDGTPSTDSSPCTGKSCSGTRTSPTSTARITGARVSPEPDGNGVGLASPRWSI